MILKVLLQINIMLKACVDLCGKSVSYAIALLENKVPREVLEVCSHHANIPLIYMSHLVRVEKKGRNLTRFSIVAHKSTHPNP